MRSTVLIAGILGCVVGCAGPMADHHTRPQTIVHKRQGHPSPLTDDDADKPDPKAQAYEASRQREAQVRQASISAEAHGEDGLRAKDCDLRVQIQEYADLIARQKRINKASGTINWLVIRDATAAKLDLEDDLKQVEAEYREVVGRAFLVRDCTPLFTRPVN